MGGEDAEVMEHSLANPSVSSNPHTSSQNPTQLSSSHLRIFATKNQHFIIGLKGSSVSLSMSSRRTKKQSTQLENCTEKAQEAADSQIPIVIPSIRVTEKLSMKKSERFTYLVAAVMSSFGITSMAVMAVYYRFYRQMEGGNVPLSEMLGAFALSVGAAVSSLTASQLGKLN